MADVDAEVQESMFREAAERIVKSVRTDSDELRSFWFRLMYLADLATAFTCCSLIMIGVKAFRERGVMDLFVTWTAASSLGALLIVTVAIWMSALRVVREGHGGLEDLDKRVEHDVEHGAVRLQRAARGTAVVAVSEDVLGPVDR